MRWLSILIVLLHTPALAHPTNHLAQRYQELVPTVVTIHTFENQLREGKTQFASRPNGLGSGVIVSKDGLIATAAHVVHAVDGLHVEFHTGEKRRAKVISSVVWADLALIKVEELPAGSKVAKLADSSKAQVGEQIFVIGAPLGISKTLTVGYVSGLHPAQTFPVMEAAARIQTDAAINPGNSGGPMFNLDGKVIGIASYIQSLSGGSDGLGFAVASNEVKQWLLDKRPFWSGIVFVPVTEPVRQALNLPFAGGVIIEKVNQGSAAYQAGLKGGTIESQIAGQKMILGGDIIASVNGMPLSNIHSNLQTMMQIRSRDFGDSLTVEVWRQGQLKKIKVGLSND